MRVDMIKNGHLEMEQSWCVCRSYLKHWVYNLKKRLAQEEVPCEQDNQADEAEAEQTPEENPYDLD